MVYALGVAFLLVVAVWVLGGAVRPENVSAAGWASAIVSGILYYALAYWLYLSALRLVPASIAAVSFYLIAVFGVAGGVLFLGERLEAIRWVGVAVVLIAIAAIFWRTGEAPERAALVPES